jgi:hypothetical protein
MRPIQFVRREGPRLFLDTRDLISLIEKSEPLSVAQLARRLQHVHGRVVLVYTTVAELVPQTEFQKADRGRVREIMKLLEQLPLSYMRSPEISRHEFRAAIDAFESGKPVQRVDPYVDQWWETFWKIPPDLMERLRPRGEINLLRSLPLWKQVEILVVNNPEALRFGAIDQDEIRKVVEDDRQRLGTSRGSAKSFLAGVKNTFIRHQWPEPKGGIEAFSEFVRSNADVCPGWRISHDVYEEYRCNLSGSVTKNDIPDFSHILILPYVTHATLDRAWRSRCAQAKNRLQKSGLSFAAYDRIHANLADVLTSLSAA